MTQDVPPSSPRRPRRQLRLATLLILVALVGVPLAWIAVERRRANRQAESLRISDALFNRVRELLDGQIQPLGQAPGVTSYSAAAAGSADSWSVTVEAETEPRPDGPDVLDLEVQGGVDGPDLRPLTVLDGGASANPEALEILRREFQPPRWPAGLLRVEPRGR